MMQDDIPTLPPAPQMIAPLDLGVPPLRPPPVVPTMAQDHPTRGQQVVRAALASIGAGIGSGVGAGLLQGWTRANLSAHSYPAAGARTNYEAR